MMKKLLLICVLFIFGFSGLNAEVTRVRIGENDQAFLFNLNGLTALTAGNFGGGIGYQYYISDDIAVRLGFGLNSFNETSKDPLADSSSVDSEYNTFDFQISPGIRYCFAYSSTIAAYVGAELFYINSSELSNYPNFKKTDPEVEISTNSFGIGFILGAEWFAWENVSLGAEYKLLYTTTSGTSKTTQDGNSLTVDMPSTTTFGVGASSYNFTISFFFN